jgi:hypothetical protein
MKEAIEKEIKNASKIVEFSSKDLREALKKTMTKEEIEKEITIILNETPIDKQRQAIKDLFDKSKIILYTR